MRPKTGLAAAPAVARGRRTRAVRWTLGALLLAALGPAYAITVSKLNVQNTTAAASNNQRVNLFGLPALSLSSAADGITTKPYDVLTVAPYPYATSTNTLAKFGFATPGVTIAKSEYASATVGTIDPAAALSISGWSWYTNGTRLGTVPDPSMHRRLVPAASLPNGGVGPSGPYIALEVTYANTQKPKQYDDELFQSLLPPPTVTISYPDFGCGLVKQGDSRPAVEAALTQLAVAKVNPRSSGNLPPPGGLVRGCNHKLGLPWVTLHNGRSCADSTHTTDFAEPVFVPAPGAGPVPDDKNPVTAMLTSATPDVNGVNPLTTMRVHSSKGSVLKFAMGPGATVTFQLRFLLGAAHVQAGVPFKVLFLARMREHSVAESDVTDALFCGAADYPTAFTFTGAGATALRAPGSVDPRQTAAARGRALQSSRSASSTPATLDAISEPQDRQYWAHLLKLYNRSLRSHVRTDESLPGSPHPIRQGRF